MGARSRLLAALVVLLLVFAGPAGAGDAIEHLRRIAAAGDRGAGTAGAKETADYVHAVFSSLPASARAVVGRQFFDLPVRVAGEARLRAAGREIPIFPLFANSLAPETLPADGVRGPLLHGGGGSLAELSGKKLDGAIVLLDLASGGNWQHAAALGARAAIYLDDGQHLAPRAHFRDKEELTPVDFPRYWLPLADFTGVFGAPAAIEGTIARLSGESRWDKQLAENVYCLLPGENPEYAGEVLVVEAFQDAGRYVLGHAPAADQGLSLATLLALAEELAATGPERSVLLLASAGHGNHLAGLRQALFHLFGDKEELAKELEQRQSQAKTVAEVGEALARGRLGGEVHSDDDPVHVALRDELRNEIERLNTRLRLARRGENAETVEIKALAREKLTLRRLSWEHDYHRLAPEDRRIIEGLLPSALARNQRLRADLGDRLAALESGAKLRQTVGKKRVVAAVSLHLSSHGDGVAALEGGYLYQPIPTINRARLYPEIRAVLKAAAEKQATAYLDLLAGAARSQWQSAFPDRPALGGELTALVGLPGFTLATVNDLRATWQTPYDTLARVDGDKALAQARLVIAQLRALGDRELPATSAKAVNGFATLSGRANFLRQGEVFAEQPAERVLLQISQDSGSSLVWVDSLGQFRLPGLADKRHSYGKAIIEGYRFLPGENRASWAIDKAVTDKDRYRVKLNRGRSETDLVLFGCVQTTLFGLREARNQNFLTRLRLLDGRSETEPGHYWYSRVDSRQSTLVSLFLEPDTPFKLTLSDTILERKLVLLGNSEDDPEGRGFLASATPAVHNTLLRAAADMVRLTVPRVDNLRRHSIVNQRIDQLLDLAESELALAEGAAAGLLHAAAAHHTGNSLAAIARVYNDVDRTQRDVLAGVLFFIALFIPFAYCLERLLFAHVSIHKRLLSFTGLLLAIIALIAAVHPAFKLTYSPLVVILAFFILGLSALVTLILIGRFEREMENLQHRAHVAGGRSISAWAAFRAAFAIGVTNLRRRKARTALTCATLAILTYTLLNFTSVKNSLEHGAVRFASGAPHQGVVLKAPEWRDLPPELAGQLREATAGEGRWLRRVWAESGDKTRASQHVLRSGAGQATASGLVGLDPGEAEARNLGRTLLLGGWLREGENDQILLSRELAEQLGIASLASQPVVTLWGMPLKVRGIFDGKAYQQTLDLDGEPLTPVIYPNETSSEMSEAEAEAAESGEEISRLAGRYQHLEGSDTAIVPVELLLAAGGRLKSLALTATDGDGGELARRLADRYQLLVFNGSEDGVWLHYAVGSLSYGGMGKILIPFVIAILILLNTMVGSVVERKREIAIYTSVGLAPPHVASLFVAEAMAFGIISAVIGYLAAQSAAHLLADTPLWAGMTANYSSLAGVGALVVVMAVVLLSVIYPSRVASRIAIPDITRSFRLPAVHGASMTVPLPFLFKLHEQDCIGGFLLEYYQAHVDVAHGRFAVEDLDVEYACPVGMGHAEHPACFTIAFRAWLAPFDFAIRQRVSILSCPSLDYPGFLEINLMVVRQSGEKNVWHRLCREFVNDLRRQLLIWRSLSAEEKQRFEPTVQARILPLSEVSR